MTGTVLRIGRAHSAAVEAFENSLDKPDRQIVRRPRGRFNLTLSDAPTFVAQVAEAHRFIAHYQVAIEKLRLHGADCELDFGIQSSDTFPVQTLRIPSATLGLLSEFGIVLAVTRYE